MDIFKNSYHEHWYHTNTAVEPLYGGHYWAKNMYVRVLIREVSLFQRLMICTQKYVDLRNCPGLERCPYFRGTQK